MQEVVGLGGSAGSIEALKTFFSYMPEDSGLAFVVVLHLSPQYESRLAGILQEWTAMPVILVCEPIKVEADRVYVIPPRKHLLMADGHNYHSSAARVWQTLGGGHFLLHPGRNAPVPFDRYSSVRCRL